MRMTSFVVTIGDFFLMETTENFPVTHQKYVIPKYQREYKWTTEKVETLITDINNRDKFLGNIILNKVSNYYEIVDGQQRITTILLILIALFNKNKLDSGTELSEEQREIYRYLIKNDYPILENESIGEYVHINLNEIFISIDDSNDIYYQKDTFFLIYKTIMDQLNEINDLRSFQKKVLDCQILVLIGETQLSQNDSIEDIFMDINFKSQLLDVADIFKGYCFKNYAATFHNELKEQWTIIRRYIKEFKIIGYNDNDKETCQYLYYYLLSCHDTYNILSNLTINGKHYLDGKSNTQTKQLLIDMGNYGQNIINFIHDLDRNNYYFENLCHDAEKHKTETSSHQILKQMLHKIILNPNVQYYKFPILMVIHHLLKISELKDRLTYENLNKFITNYYIYSFFFICGSKKKNKQSIDHTILDSLYSNIKNHNIDNAINDLLKTVKALRIKYLSEYKQFSKIDIEKMYALYSLIDNYSAANNCVNLLYSSASSYTQEPLIIHNNKNSNITWTETDNEFIFSLKSLFNKNSDTISNLNKYKNSIANYIILPEILNGNMNQKDIVEKINMIKTHYNKQIPKHISLIISHIETNTKYLALAKLKGQKEKEETIKTIYKQFIDEYFSDDSQRQLSEKLELTLKQSFRNNN